MNANVEREVLFKVGETQFYAARVRKGRVLAEVERHEGTVIAVEGFTVTPAYHMAQVAVLRENTESQAFVVAMGGDGGWEEKGSEYETFEEAMRVAAEALMEVGSKIRKSGAELADEWFEKQREVED